MKDSGTVVTTEKGFAQVQIHCLDACNNCAASRLCIKNEKTTGLLSVRNPLKARPGDSVTVDVPEAVYSKALVRLFGILLAGCLAGMALGYSASAFIALGASESSLIGLFLGLSVAGLWLFRYFRHTNRVNLYPVITGIIDKGECHG